jgi:putative NIF3 family GTP cyclohydrolase 1 type 2
MKANELQAYLRSLNEGWLNPEATVDTFKAGDPQAEVHGIAVGWMSYTWALQRALDLGCNVFVTHEPTFYDHHDNNQRMFEQPGVREKQHWIEEKGLVILRCHDLWDQAPGVGIPDSWGSWLGLGNAIAGEGYYRVYDVSGSTALQVAQRAAARLVPFGQEAVQLVGPAERPVTRAVIGTGAITPFLHILTQYGADLAICTDDGVTYWRDAAYAIDMGIPMIVVNHHVSEEAGMMNLAKQLQQKFPQIPVHHVAQKCMYRLINVNSG